MWTRIISVRYKVWNRSNNQTEAYTWEGSTLNIPSCPHMLLLCNSQKCHIPHAYPHISYWTIWWPMILIIMWWLIHTVVEDWLEGQVWHACDCLTMWVPFVGRINWWVTRKVSRKVCRGQSYILKGLRTHGKVGVSGVQGPSQEIGWSSIRWYVRSGVCWKACWRGPIWVCDNVWNFWK